MQAMILAAGLGTRLLPHTELRPKPLFPLLNEPLLLLTIRRLKRYGFEHIIVNCHHLAEQIIDSLDGIEGVVTQREEKILGTGGGLRRAFSEMRDEPILVTNGDIYHTVNYLELYRKHKGAESDVTLAMHDYPRFNTVPVEGDRIVDLSRRSEKQAKLAFTGLSVINPQVLLPLVDGETACIIEHYRQELHNGLRITAHRVDDCFWTDMGTPEDYLALHQGLLQGRIPLWTEFTSHQEGSVILSAQAKLTGETILKDWCSIGAVTGHNISLEECVVWDGVELPPGFHASNALISSSPVKC